MNQEASNLSKQRTQLSQTLRQFNSSIGQTINTEKQSPIFFSSLNSPDILQQMRFNYEQVNKLSNYSHQISKLSQEIINLDEIVSDITQQLRGQSYRLFLPQIEHFNGCKS